MAVPDDHDDLEHRVEPDGPADPETGDHEVEDEPTLFAGDTRTLIRSALLIVVIVVAIYVLAPKVLDLDDAINKFGQADPVWILVALGFCVLMFLAYVAEFRGVVGENVLHLEWSESYQITLAGLAATRLFSAGGAGGMILTYWALRKARMERREAAGRMITFLVLLYAVYMLSVVLFGTLLRTGALPGAAPLSVTVVPAAIAGGVILGFMLLALVPSNLDKRLSGWAAGETLRARIARRLVSIPATVGTGTRRAIAFLRHPRKAALAVGGAVGFWAANIGILWAAFQAFDVSVPAGVLIQGFFVGMAANLLPFAPGGVGAVDAGMIGAFAIFGLPETEVFAAVLWYRVIAFWLPIPPGIIAYVQLRKTVARWEEERAPHDRATAVPAAVS